MSASLLLQRSHVAVAAITSSRQQLLESSMFQSSSLALPSYGRSGDFSRLGRNSPIKRHVSSGVAQAKFWSSDKKKEEEGPNFYIQEIRSKDPSDTTATVKPLKPLKPQWGFSCVFDNEVRAGIDANSELLGRERGWCTVSDKEGMEGWQQLSKISFTDGENKGSSLTFQGNIVVGGGVETELIILGGTGDFRGKHGFALVNSSSGDGGRYKFHWKVVFLK